MCVAVRAHPMPESVCQPITGHAVGRRSTLWILLFGRAALEVQKVVHATQTTSYLRPPPNSLSSAEQPSLCSPSSPFPGPQNLGCGLWMSATSWLSAQGLAGDWPVVEVQYQALSVSSSFDFLPPLGTGRRQWHKHTLSCD